MRPDKAAASLLEVDDEPEDKTEAAPETEREDESEEVDAARDLIAAVKSGDAKAASLALSRHYELCKDKGEEEEPGSGRY